MAIAFDATSNNGEATGATSTTWSHTVGASLSNSILVVSLSTRDGSNTDQMCSGVTYGGVALTRLGFAEYIGGPPIRADIWYLVNPTAGAANIVASFPGTVDHMSCGACSFSGVDQAVPFVNNIGKQAATGAGDISLAIQSIVANAWTVDAAYNKTSSDMTIDGSRTSRWQLSPNTNGDRAASGTYNGIVTPADTTHSWATSPDDDFVYIIGALRPAGIYSSGVDIVSENGSRGLGSSLTFSHTFPSGFSNTILVVGISVQDSNHANMPITSVTFNGDALTKVRSDEATGNNRSELWYRVAPDVATGNVVVTATGTLGEIAAFALGFCNVDQASPIDANGGTTGTSSSPSHSLITVASNAWTVAICSAEERFTNHGTQAARAGGPKTDQTYENALIATKFVPTGASTALGFGIASSQSYAVSTLSLKPGSGDVTTTQTVTGKARITTTTTQTVTGKSRVTATTARTVTGLARITVSTARTLAGLARITATTARTIAGLARITATTLRTITGTARIEKSATQTITGLSRIQVSTTQNVTGLSRITATTLQTIAGLARITATTSQTVDGKSRIEKSQTQTIAGTARVTTSTTRTITGVANIVNQVNRTITGVAKVKKAPWYALAPTTWYNPITQSWQGANATAWNTQNTLGWYVSNSVDWQEVS